MRFEEVKYVEMTKPLPASPLQFLMYLSQVQQKWLGTV